jgi:GntR family transcriptional repressor for pyruvate dehydrogenase complex
MIPRKTMAETMAEQIREAILAGAWKPGTTIPTEPELAKQFGVSRAVVRDATRIIAAWGLVEARQGKGVYVTADQAAGFGTALLLALRRTGTTVWDVEEFEQILFPQAAAMVASRLGEIDIDTLRRRLKFYEKSIVKQVRNHPGENWFVGETREAWFHFVDTFFEMTGNRLMAQLGPALVRIRNVRVFDGEPDVDPAAVSRREIRNIEKILAAVGTGIPEEAHSVTTKLLNLPEEVETAMKKTPVGEAARIPMDLEDFLKGSGN